MGSVFLFLKSGQRPWLIHSQLFKIMALQNMLNVYTVTSLNYQTMTTVFLVLFLKAHEGFLILDPIIIQNHM